MNEIRNIAVIGTGVIGAGWVTLFALKGYRVYAYSRRTETRQQGLKTIQTNLDFMSRGEIISQDDKSQSLERISLVSEISEAVRDADFVAEAAADSYDIKKQLLPEIEEHAPAHAILTSSSSGLDPTVLQRVIVRKDKFLIAHPWNPPHLIPLVEVVPGEHTSEDTTARTMDFMERLGKTTVRVNKAVPGYIGNRLAAALWREAIDLVVEGVASVEDVDKSLFAGPGIRWAFMGQHLIYHLGGGEPGGIGHFIEGIGNTTFKSIWQDLATWNHITDSMKEQLIRGVKEEMKDKSFKEIAQWRDEKLVELLKLIYRQ